MKRDAIETFFATLRSANPLPVTELEYTTVFELLTAVLLSAQATDVGVNKATRRLFPVANTPQKILALGLPKLESYIQTIGLYRSKAKHLMQTCEQQGVQLILSGLNPQPLDILQRTGLLDRLKAHNSVSDGQTAVRVATE